MFDEDFDEDDADVLAQAGDLKEVSAWGNDPGAETLRLLNEHTVLVRALAREVNEGKRTQSERATQVERMIAAATEKRAAQLGSTALDWVPGGDDSISLRIYGDEEKGLRLLTSKRKIVLPGGHSRTIDQRGFLTDPYPVTRAQQELQRLYLDFAVAARICKARKAAPWENDTVQNAYLRFFRALERQPGQLGRMLRDQLDTAVRAMSGGTALGAEWVLEPQLDTLIRPYDLATTFLGRINQRGAPAKLFTRPTITGEVVFRRAGNVTSNDPSAYPVSDVTTGEVSTSIPSLAARMVLDKQWLDDMAKLVDPSEFVAQIRRGADRTLRGAIINGDTAATHQDTGIETWTVNGKYTAGTMGGSDSPYKVILGFRARAADDSTTNDCAQSFSAATGFASLERMGNRAQSDSIAWLTNLHVLHTQMMPADEFLTVDKIGSDMATIRSGTFGMFLGKPVDTDEFVTNDLDGTTFLYDGSGDTTSILMAVDYAAYDLWVLQGQEDFEVIEAHKGAVHIGATMRLGLASNCATGEKPVSLDGDL